MTIVPDGGRRVVAILLLLGFAGGIASCGASPRGPRTDLEWPWWPETMRIVDLTRVGRSNVEGRRPIEVRVLFEDAGGLPVRAAASRRRGRPGQRTGRSGGDELDLADPEVSLAMFEEITGCYMVPVYVDFPGLIEGRRMEVVADYVGRDGTVFADELRFDLEMDLVD